MSKDNIKEEKCHKTHKITNILGNGPIVVLYFTNQEQPNQLMEKNYHRDTTSKKSIPSLLEDDRKKYT